MKSLEELWRVAARDLAAWCRTSAERDCKTVTARFENEGLSFLAITLPAFAKDFERSLDAGRIDPDAFSLYRKRGYLPVFLGGFLDRVFDRLTGLLLDGPDVDCIFAIRQLTLMFKKIHVDCAPHRTRGAIRGYIECEKEVEEAARLVPDELYKRFARVAALLFEDVFVDLEYQVYEGTLTPRHGPGATADGLRGNSKFHQLEWPERMESVFPYWENAAPGEHYAIVPQYAQVDFLEPGAERPVKVITVPKTPKTPRIIAVEPTCMQYMQQAISERLVENLEAQRIMGNTRENLCQGMVGFTDQMPNRLLAREGSLTGKLATLDLSEASDRVSVRHVEFLVSRWPLLREALLATRSSKASVPGHGVISLSKFASMGSALTFPLEAMVFLTAAFLGIEDGLSRTITRKDVMSLRDQVRVYGDDIIVPTDSVHAVMQTLEALGFKINKPKSFWNGKFRESCGGDYWDGIDVTPVKVTQILPASRADVASVVSTVELRNAFYLKGMWMTAAHLDKTIRRILPYFPIVEPSSPLLGRTSFLPYQEERLCTRLHRPLVKGYVKRDRIPSSPTTGYGALLKFFLKRGYQPFADAKHLERQGRPEHVDINARWMTPF